jgi:hypothetical protein
VVEPRRDAGFPFEALPRARHAVLAHDLDRHVPLEKPVPRFHDATDAPLPISSRTSKRSSCAAVGGEAGRLRFARRSSCVGSEGTGGGDLSSGMDAMIAPVAEQKRGEPAHRLPASRYLMPACAASTVT